MTDRDLMAKSFLDELEKIAASRGLSLVSKSRGGRRPISVTKLIEKHNAGTWLKGKKAAATGPQDVRGDAGDDPGAAQPVRKPGEVPTKVPNIAVDQKLGAPYTFEEAVKPKKKGDVPSKDDPNMVDRRDGRDNATTISDAGGLTIAGTGNMEHS